MVRLGQVRFNKIYFNKEEEEEEEEEEENGICARIGSLSRGCIFYCIEPWLCI